MMLSDYVCLTSVCLSVAYIGPKSRTGRLGSLGRPKLAERQPTSHVTRTSLSRSKGQRSRSPGRFAHRGLNGSGRCSSDRENVLGVGNYCYVASARRCERRWGAHGGGEGRGHIVSPRAQLQLFVSDNEVHKHAEKHTRKRDLEIQIKFNYLIYYYYHLLLLLLIYYY